MIDLEDQDLITEWKVVQEDQEELVKVVITQLEELRDVPVLEEDQEREEQGEYQEEDKFFRLNLL